MKRRYLSILAGTLVLTLASVGAVSHFRQAAPESAPVMVLLDGLPFSAETLRLKAEAAESVTLPGYVGPTTEAYRAYHAGMAAAYRDAANMAERATLGANLPLRRVER